MIIINKIIVSLVIISAFIVGQATQVRDTDIREVSARVSSDSAYEIISTESLPIGEDVRLHKLRDKETGSMIYITTTRSDFGNGTGRIVSTAISVR